MKVKFPVNPIVWMLTINIIYMIVGFADLYYHWWPVEYVQAVWCLVLSLPLWIPMHRIVAMDPIWKEFRK